MKSRKRTRSSNNDVGLDKLSEMPDNVIVHVLSLMPTRDAVRTMLLRRFGYLWTLLPNLTLSFNDFYATPDDEDDEYDREDDTSEEERRLRSEAFSRFARYVRNVLMLHRRPTIVYFNLFIGDRKSHHVDPCLMDDVQLWLKFAIDREVTHLIFGCDYHDNFALPRCIFTSQSIVTLAVVGGMLVHYKSQPQLHMGSLTKLSLLAVHGSNEAYDQLISACSSLEELKIFQPKGLLNLNITSPSVSRLKLDDIFDVHDRPFTLNCPHVQYLEISFGQFPGNTSSFPVDVIDVSTLHNVTVGRLPGSWSGPVITAFFRHFRNASFFKFSSTVFEQICLKEADIPRTRWQCLVLQPDWDDERCLQVITDCLTSSLNLKLFVIGEDHQSSYNLQGVGPELSTSSVLLPQLQHVLFDGYQTDCEAQLQVVEFILRNAVDLKDVDVWLPEDGMTAVEQLEIVKQVSRMKRASASATVNFV